MELEEKLCENAEAFETEEMPPVDEMEGLRAEAERLRSEAESLRAELSAERKLSAELREFAALYPETAVEEIPDGVWDAVKGGIPLAAAFALHERRSMRERAAAEADRARARARSTGPLENGGGDMYYSPAEVRAMSAADVRQNYSTILASMKRWQNG